MITDHAFDVARRNLTLWMIGFARIVAKNQCIGYTAVANAPDNMEDLVAMYKDCRANGSLFLVSDGNCDNTIYINHEGNWAFRFWHDYLHVSAGLDMSYVGEIQLAKLQQTTVDNYFGSESLEAHLFFADTAGQATYCQLNGEFPTNQLEFCKNFVNAMRISAN